MNDVTVEKLGELLNENSRGLLLVRDELHGALSRLDRDEYQSERAFYLEAYNGDGPFTFDRIGRGTIHIPCCTLSMIGGTQPSRISSLVAAANKGSGSDGLLQRFQLAVWPNEPMSWDWVDNHPNRQARETYSKAIRDFRQLDLACAPVPTTFRFSPAAQGRPRRPRNRCHARSVRIAISRR